MAVTVRVPATSANLGPGFDTLGLALDMWDEVSAEPSDELTVDVVGEGMDDVPRDASHLVLRAFRHGFETLGQPAPNVRLSCRNAIPHSRGLGSSAAAISAGLLLARALGAGVGEEDLLALAAQLEGHPDNVAACLLGGVTVSWTEAGRAAARRLEPAPGIEPVAFIPETGSSTEQARGMLPASVPHPDAAFNAARAALLVFALTADPALLLVGTEDRLHQQYRAASMPDSTRLLEALRADGIPAVISGAGPTVLALARGDAERSQATARAPEGWRCQPLSIADHGAAVSASRDRPE